MVNWGIDVTNKIKKKIFKSLLLLIFVIKKQPVSFVNSWNLGLVVSGLFVWSGEPQDMNYKLKLMEVWKNILHIESFWSWSTRKSCVTCVTHIFQIFFKINFFKISLWKLKVGFIFFGFNPVPSITLGLAFWQQSIYEFITCFLGLLNLRICLFFSRNFKFHFLEGCYDTK